MKKKRIVCLDPGNSDIFYAVSKEKEDIITFRYTQNQKRLETRNNKYNKIQDKINKETIIGI